VLYICFLKNDHSTCSRLESSDSEGISCLNTYSKIRVVLTLLGFEPGDKDYDYVEKGSHSRKSLKMGKRRHLPHHSFHPISSDGTSAFGDVIFRPSFCIDLRPTTCFLGNFIFLGVEWVRASLRLMYHPFRLLILQPRYFRVREEVMEFLVPYFQET
jgi:hypothetical protein